MQQGTSWCAWCEFIVWKQGVSAGFRAGCEFMGYSGVGNRAAAQEQAGHALLAVPMFGIAMKGGLCT